MNPKIGDLIYAGKAKDVYKTENPEHVIVKFRDDITAGDGIKTESLVEKGIYNSAISSKFFEILEDSGVKTQYIKLIKPGYMLCKKLDMISFRSYNKKHCSWKPYKEISFQRESGIEPTCNTDGFQKRRVP